MKLLFDHSIFSYQNVGGISRYFSNLYLELNNIIDISLPLISSQNIYLDEMLLKPKFNFIKNKKLSFVLNEFYSLKEIFSNDVIHQTTYNLLSTKYFGKKVLTIYDMIHEKFPEYYGKTRVSEIKKIMAKKADKIICISENTKKDF